MMSAENAAPRLAAIAAPFWAYAASEKPAAAPAPDSRTTLRPLLTSLATSAGTSATRRSPGKVSLTTATFILQLYSANCAGGTAHHGLTHRRSLQDRYPPQS